MEAEHFKGKERRRYFRIKYPEELRPTLRIRKHEFEVIDICERGLRFLNDKKAKFANWISATVTFFNGSCFKTEGRIIRKQKDEVALYLIASIPYPLIVKEQQFLIRTS